MHIITINRILLLIKIDIIWDIYLHVKLKYIKIYIKHGHHQKEEGVKNAEEYEIVKAKRACE